MDRKIPKPSFSTRRRFKHFCTAFLLGSVSLYAVKSLYELEPETFSKSSVVLNKDTVDIRDFYDNLSYDLKQKGWFYTKTQGKRISLDSISDYRIKDHQVYKNVAGQKYRVTVDTVRVRYPEPAEGKRFPTYHISGADSQNMPSMGSQSWGKVRVREFVVDSTLAPDRQKHLQKIWDNYNDSLNCTEEHEKQHRLNEIAGIMQAGQSFDNKFIECCLDEVSANIRQLLAQRKNYLKRGRSLEQITPRFSFYAELIRNGTVKPRANILTKKEISLIGNGVFDSWMKEKFGMYAARNANRTQNILFKTNANGTEQGQTLAVIPLFDHAHAFAGYNGTPIVGTYKDAEFNPKEFTVTIHFKENSVEESKLALNKLNFFITCNATQGKRMEIHQINGKATDLFDTSAIGGVVASPNTPFRAKGNFCWVMIIPGEFSFPLEGNNLRQSFENFELCIANPDYDWYNHPFPDKVKQ